MIQTNWNCLQITAEEIKLANQEYAGLIDIVTCSLPDSLLQPLLQRLHLEKVQRQSGEQITAKQFLFNCDLALRSVVAKEALQWRKGNVTQVMKHTQMQQMLFFYHANCLQIKIYTCKIWWFEVIVRRLSNWNICF